VIVNGRKTMHALERYIDRNTQLNGFAIAGLSTMFQASEWLIPPKVVGVNQTCQPRTEAVR
jgi:hypothetical protein